jgi:hypothetical protein
MHQTPHPAEAPRLPNSSTSGLVVSIGTWSVVFSSLLILLQLGLLYVFRANYTLSSRTGGIILTFAVLELGVSFFAALIVASRTGRIWTGIFAGAILLLLSGITDLYLTVTAWRTVLARIHSLVLEAQVRQAIGRSVVELLAFLLLCLALATLGALVGDRLAKRPHTYQSYRPITGSGSLPTVLDPHVAGDFPETPTPNGWRFDPNNYSQTSRSNSAPEVDQWRYSPPSNFPAHPAQLIGNYEPPLPEPAAGDAPTQPDTGNTPTELFGAREDTALPLPYPGRDSRYSPN